MIGWKFSDWISAGGSGRYFGWKFWNSPRLGESDIFLLGSVKVRSSGGADGDVVGRSEIEFHSVKRTGLGLVNVQIG